MSALDNTPQNKSLLQPNGFRFIIKKLPNVNYFCQSATIPTISLASVDTPSPFGIVPRPGDRLLFEQFTLRFKVDENLQNYKEIYTWLAGLGRPNNFDQYKTLSNQTPLPAKEGSAASVVSDATLVVLTSHKNGSMNVFFRDVFPTSLSELTFDSTISDVEYLEATATFRYRSYDLESV